MNALNGIISKIEINGNLSLVHLVVGESILKSIVIETPESAPYLKAGNSVQVLFNENEVIIGLPGAEVSLQNRLTCTVTSIEEGKLLSRIELDHPQGSLTSVITSHAVHQLGITPGDEVIAMIKTNEIMLAE